MVLLERVGFVVGRVFVAVDDEVVAGCLDGLLEVGRAYGGRVIIHLRHVRGEAYAGVRDALLLF